MEKTVFDYNEHIHCINFGGEGGSGGGGEGVKVILCQVAPVVPPVRVS